LTASLIAGLLQIFTNFSQTKDAVSGPLAIVAAGADVARSDAASLFQFAAIVNVNLAMVNALPLPVSTPPPFPPHEPAHLSLPHERSSCFAYKARLSMPP
jgi:hypothetical protein